MPRVTTYLNKSQLTSILTSTDLAQPRTLQISVAMNTLDDAQSTSITQSKNSINFVVTPAALKILTTSVPAAVVQAPYSVALRCPRWRRAIYLEGGFWPATQRSELGGFLGSDFWHSNANGTVLLFGPGGRAHLRPPSALFTLALLRYLQPRSANSNRPRPQPRPTHRLCIGIVHSSGTTTILHRYVYAHPDWFDNQCPSRRRFPGRAEWRELWRHYPACRRCDVHWQFCASRPVAATAGLSFERPRRIPVCLPPARGLHRPMLTSCRKLSAPNSAPAIAARFGANHFRFVADRSDDNIFYS